MSKLDSFSRTKSFFRVGLVTGALFLGGMNAGCDSSALSYFISTNLISIIGAILGTELT